MAMAGLSYSDESRKAGLAYISTGNGSHQDWSVHKARKPRRCGHVGPHGARWKFDFPCEHPEINRGEWYVTTRQSLWDDDYLSIECAIRAGVYTRIAEQPS